MMNKHRIELIQWFGNVKSFVENEKDFYLFIYFTVSSVESSSVFSHLLSVLTTKKQGKVDTF